MAQLLNNQTSLNIPFGFSPSNKSVIGYVIDAISDLAGVNTGSDEKVEHCQQTENFAPDAMNYEACSETESDVFDADPEPRTIQRPTVNELLLSSFAYIEQLIDNGEFSEAIDFTKDLIDRFNADLLQAGLEHIFKQKGTAWLETHLQQLTAARGFIAMQFSQMEEKSQRQYMKLPEELQSEITFCMSSSTSIATKLWPKIREKASTWLLSIKSRDIDLDRFVESLGKFDKELRRLDAIEVYFVDKLEAALALSKMVPDLVQAASASAQSATNRLAEETQESISTASNKLSLTFSEYQRAMTEKLLYAIANQNLEELKRMLTGFAGTTSDFNTIVRAIEELVRPFGINVTSAYGHHWAMFSLESADCHFGVEFRFPSGRISGHLKGTSFNQKRTVEALANIAHLLSGAPRA